MTWLRTALKAAVAISLLAALWLLKQRWSFCIGTLNAKGRLSIMVSYIEPYLRLLRLRGRSQTVIVLNPGADPNTALSRMYGREVCLLDDRRPIRRWFVSQAYRALRWYQGWAGYLTSLDANLSMGLADHFGYPWREGKPTLRFTNEEMFEGAALLKRLGVVSAPYVCFGVREAEYYRQFQAVESLKRHPNSEAQDDTFIRNPPISNYLLMAQTLAHRGYYVLRMGSVPGEPLPAGLHPRIVDYATHHRTPLGDLFLLAHCRFAVSGGAGFWWVATAFNRPVVFTDHYAPRVRPPRPGDLFIQQLVVRQGQPLTFAQMLDAGTAYAYRRKCDQDDAVLRHNTPEEIRDVALEMDDRLAGRWTPSVEDEQLLRRWKDLYASATLRHMAWGSADHQTYGMPGQLGAAFLRTHRGLLG